MIQVTDDIGEFKPFSITIKFENRADAVALYCLFNHKSILKALDVITPALGAGRIRASIGEEIVGSITKEFMDFDRELKSLIQKED
jgi:prolipoprotein diacylglyceryltransferase